MTHREELVDELMWLRESISRLQQREGELMEELLCHLDGAEIDAQSVREFKKLIADEEGEMAASTDAIISIGALELGFDRETSEKALERLKMKGEVYEPANGRWRTT